MNANLTLQTLAKEYQHKHLFDIFQQNPLRFQQFHHVQDGILFDFSKQRLDQQVLQQLVCLAKEKQLAQWIERLFSQQSINYTENRSAMHWALREPCLTDTTHENYAINQAIHAELNKVESLVKKIHTGQLRGAYGDKIVNIVNIGVGGSDLGPLMACHALQPYYQHHHIRVYFASTMDGSQLSQVIEKLNPRETLFIISSKSFTTIDTLQNAQTARRWLIDHLGDAPAVMNCHFIGVSANREKMTAWGIAPEAQFLLWQWVGGRYSLWSAIGLPIAICVGMENFRALLAGAYAMDQHFRQADWQENLPVLLALIGIWNNNYLDIHTHAILPYDGRLKYFTSYMQQLEMESNGKSIRRDNHPVEDRTCPVIWGEVGPNAQHAFYQLLHQGTSIVSSDFIIAQSRYADDTTMTLSKLEKPSAEFQQQHRLSIANCLAQSRLLAFGNHAVEDSAILPLYQQYQGNKPSTTIVIPELSPYYLGALIAMYEHKVFVQSVIWDINPFDQWGVEMGKKIANELLPILAGQHKHHHFDLSTEGLLAMFIHQD